MAFKKAVPQKIQDRIIQEIKNSLDFANEEAEEWGFNTSEEGNIITAEFYDDAFPGQIAEQYQVFILIGEKK